jgi:predicted AAA+ superfamily ATPase
VFIVGARQVGKSTLAMELSDNYVTLDDLNAYLAAKQDPIGFIKNLEKPVVLDEVHKVPQLFDVIKQAIDADRKPGQFILTGSADILSFSRVRESLAGRVGVFELYPFSVCELLSCKNNLIDSLVSGDIVNRESKLVDDAFLEFVLKGGYPEVHKIEEDRFRYMWFSSYVRTYLEKDVLELGEIRNIDKFLSLLNISASISGNVLVKSNISNDTGLDNKTLDKYLNILLLLFQITLLRNFSLNVGKRFIKSSKLYFNDTGLLCYLLGIQSIEELKESRYYGNIVETFIFSELLKSIKYAGQNRELFFYRTIDKKEIDFIIKDKNEYIAIEVKASRTIHERDVDTLKAFSKSLKYGYLLYGGNEVYSLGDNIFALPNKKVLGIR